MKKAGEIGKEVYLQGANTLKEGLSEIEFGGILEATAKRYGHEGLLRVRSLNYEGLYLACSKRAHGWDCSASRILPWGGWVSLRLFPVGQVSRS